MRERPDEVKKVLTAALKGIAYTKSHREEVLPLLKQFVGLPTVDMTRKTYDVIKELWPDNGIPSDKGLAIALTWPTCRRIFPPTRSSIGRSSGTRRKAAESNRHSVALHGLSLAFISPPETSPAV